MEYSLNPPGKLAMSMLLITGGDQFFLRIDYCGSPEKRSPCLWPVDDVLEHVASKFSSQMSPPTICLKHVISSFLNHF